MSDIPLRIRKILNLFSNEYFSGGVGIFLAFFEKWNVIATVEGLKYTSTPTYAT